MVPASGAGHNRGPAERGNCVNTNLFVAEMLYSALQSLWFFLELFLPVFGKSRSAFERLISILGFAESLSLPALEAR